VDCADRIALMMLDQGVGMDVDPAELERKAQQAAERRLAFCQAQLYADEDDDEPEPVLEDDGPCAPFCGCDTCTVREVLDAAWPYLLDLARLEVRA
jgi:hypothetical protein